MLPPAVLLTDYKSDQLGMLLVTLSMTRVVGSTWLPDQYLMNE